MHTAMASSSHLLPGDGAHLTSSTVASGGLHFTGEASIVATDASQFITPASDSVTENDLELKEEDKPGTREFCESCLDEYVRKYVEWDYKCNTCGKFVCIDCLMGDMCHDSWNGSKNKANKQDLLDRNHQDFECVLNECHYTAKEDIKCEVCDDNVVPDLIYNKFRCDYCDQFLCPNCTWTCDKCKMQVDAKHKKWHTQKCDVELHNNIGRHEKHVAEYKKCEKCQRYRNAIFKNWGHCTERTCPKTQCGKMLCIDCIDICEICQDKLCSEHFKAHVINCSS